MIESVSRSQRAITLSTNPCVFTSLPHYRAYIYNLTKPPEHLSVLIRTALCLGQGTVYFLDRFW
jgi:hypothetical protein